MCDRDCFNCRYEDCFVDSVSPKEIQSKGKEYARERAKRYRERKRIMMTVYEIMRSIDYRPEGRNYET